MSDTFLSGNTGPTIQSDCKVKYSSKDSEGNDIILNSKVAALYGDSIVKLAAEVLTAMGIDHCRLEIEDAGALPFVISARIEAAVKMAHPENKTEVLPEMKNFCTYKSWRNKFRRSRLYLPGNQPKLMLNAGLHKPDGVILDLEDAVAPIEKFSARLIVRNALRTLDFFGAERMVRINQGDLGMEDLDAVVPHNVHLILIPKVESPDQVKAIDTRINAIKRECQREEPVFLMPILESAMGVLNALQIAQSSPNIVSLAIGLEDYTADIGTSRTLEGTESFLARSMLVNAARAAGIQAIDTVFSDVGDMEGLQESVLEAKGLGFDGKGCIHPRQISVIHQGFAPSQAEITKAQKIVFAFDEAEKKGLGVVSLGSKMIDPPVVKRAIRTINLAVDSGILASNWKSASGQ